jgi:hypothetical protein
MPLPFLGEEGMALKEKLERLKELREQIHAAELLAIKSGDWSERNRLLAELREVEKWEEE